MKLNPNPSLGTMTVTKRVVANGGQLISIRVLLGWAVSELRCVRPLSGPIGLYNRAHSARMLCVSLKNVGKFMVNDIVLDLVFFQLCPHSSEC